MPIIIPKDIPAYDTLLNENIFVMSHSRAVGQDIRPIRIAIVNLMPTKEVTELQLMRLLGNTPLQVKITLVKTKTYKSKHVADWYLDKFYRFFDDIKNKDYDGLIVTGAPVETLAFEDVKYWKELTEIMEWADKHVTSTIYICWGAQAALYYRYGINKIALPEKKFGIFKTHATVPYELLLKGLDDTFYIPHSRHTKIDEDAVRAIPELEVVAESKEAGISIIKEADGKRFYFTGHTEYDRDTLDKEYKRDREKGLNIASPVNYYTDNTNTKIDVKWRSTANLLFYNWLNYYVYQITPYEIEEIAD